MELKEALLKRRSVRQFKEDKVSDEIINELMHAAMSGPSAMNKQPWKFYVITSSEKLEELKNVSKYSKITAPLAIVVCGDEEKFIPMAPEFWVEDCSAATENILLRATDLGLGSVWCGVYPDRNMSKALSGILNLTNNLHPLNVIYLGYPVNDTESRDQYDESAVVYIK